MKEAALLHSKTGSTCRIAERIWNGIAAMTINLSMMPLNKQEITSLPGLDSLAIRCPVYDPKSILVLEI